MIVDKSVAPRTGPNTPPTAPKRLVPPITDDATAFNSQVKPFEAIPKLNLAATRIPTTDQHKNQKTCMQRILFSLLELHLIPNQAYYFL